MGCQCSKGWSGIDCSSLNCKENVCSNNGICKSILGYDLCQCSSNNTGADCSSSLLPVPNIANFFPHQQ
jgi:hypothetical protein